MENSKEKLGSLIPQHQLNKLVSTYLQEDTPSFDFGGYVVGEDIGESVILCKDEGILCGVPFVNALFEKLNCQVNWFFKEGSNLKSLDKVGTVKGKVKDLLQGERIALNILCRASGIATLCASYNGIKSKNDWHGCIAGTRKTTPGFRFVEKYALLVGGCATHRYDLSSMVMLKDNHIWSVGNITNSVQKARSVCGFSTKIEVECRSVTEALEASKAGADVIMLDNFHSSIVESSAVEIKRNYPHVVIEVSGGITTDNITSYMTKSVDVISTSKLVQGYSSLDFSMKLLKEGHDPSNPMVTAMN